MWLFIYTYSAMQYAYAVQGATPMEEQDGIAGKGLDDLDDFKQRLRKDLMNRDGHR